MLSVLPITFVELVFGRFKFALVGLGHSTTASHALVQASRSSVVVQAQISVQSLTSPNLNGVGPAGTTYEP